MIYQINTVIWADDVKDVPAELRTISNELIVCRTYQQIISALENVYEENKNTKVLLCLDYHIGLKKTGTGMDVAEYVVNHHFPLTCFWIVSIYPEGKIAMQKYLEQYYPYELCLEDILRDYAVLPDVVAEVGDVINVDAERHSFRRCFRRLRVAVSAFFKSLVTIDFL